MLNLSQRLILGCTVLACLAAALVAASHKVLQAAGLSTLAYGFLAAFVGAIVLSIVNMLLKAIVMPGKESR